MLLRTAWRRVAAAVPAASPRRPEAPTRGLRLRVADHAPQSAVPSDTATAPEVESGLRPLYMDVQATAPLDPRVLDAMLPYLVNYYGNPHAWDWGQGGSGQIFELIQPSKRMITKRGLRKQHKQQVILLRMTSREYRDRAKLKPF